MTTVYGRDLDLNLLRVFVVVAEAGSVTEAASRLYLTQPAVSAALRRLNEAVGSPLFARAGRGLRLTHRGQRLFAISRHHLEALTEAALSPAVFDAKSSERTLRLGLSDSSEAWLLPPLLRRLAREAPRLRLVVLPVQFRTVGEALGAARLDLAVTVADELPADTKRLPLLHGGFVCLYDPAHARLSRKPTLGEYLAHDHVIVSYNGDLRGIVEDLLGVRRKVRVSVPAFQNVGAIVAGSALLATVPELVARDLLASSPKLRTAPLPFELAGSSLELLWPGSVDDDPAVRLVRDLIAELARDVVRSGPRNRQRSARR
jgi:LysR family transcriptional regulator, mexEF-oprN operon transcriptional activator